jgi:hypothetical protein
MRYNTMHEAVTALLNQTGAIECAYEVTKQGGSNPEVYLVIGGGEAELGVIQCIYNEQGETENAFIVAAY